MQTFSSVFRKKLAVVVFLMMVPLVSSQTDWLKGKCVGREGNRYPMPGDCSKYVQCSERGISRSNSCGSNKNYNWLTKKCEKVDQSTACEVDKNVHALEWQGLTNAEKSELEKGVELQRTSFKQEYIPDFKQFSQSVQTFGTLLRTYFLAVEDGIHNFTSECQDWCKVWIRKDGCHERKLILDQNTKKQHQNVEYNVTVPYNMTFGTFYFLEVVNFVESKSKTIKIGVRWKDKSGEEEVYPYIPKGLLRLNVSENCSYVRTTDQTSTKNLSLVVPSNSTASPSSTRSPFPSTERFSTGQPSTMPPATTAPTSIFESDVQNLTEEISKYLEPSNETSRQPFIKHDYRDGLGQVREIDRKGLKIAEKWNQKGKSLTVSRPNVVMEVDFPVTNYTFPRSKSKNTSQYDWDHLSDQIFIPAHALMNKSKEFERKVFSALYLNLNEKFPRFFNEVQVRREELIPGVYELNSRVIASTAVPRIENLQNYDIVINLMHLKTNFSSDIELLCAFYKWEESENHNGVWSTEGCYRDEEMSNNNVSVCRCNHLTHFGILMEVKEHEISSTNAKALRLISYIGCALSLVGASLTVLAISCLPGARSDRNFIHVNLALAIGFAQITFLAGIDETGNKILCTIVAALLHYFLLTAFSWMLMEGIFLHILIVKVFHDQLPKKRFYVAFCWGLPGAIVLLSANLLTDGYGTETSCWLSTDKLTIWTFSGPAILVITINIIILCKVMKEIHTLRTGGRREVTIRTVRAGIRSTIILLPLLGITWALGLICVNGSTIIFQYLFSIFNSLQGLLIFLFHCVFNTEVRKAFWRKVDLWFTTHHNPFGSHGNSRSSLKRSKDDASLTCPPNKEKKEAAPMNGFSDTPGNGENDTTRRKLSSITASSYVDSWRQRLPIDAESSVKGFTSKCSPTMAGVNDIEHQSNQLGQASEEKLSPNLGHKQCSEDLNSNTTSLEDVRIHKKPSVRRNDSYFQKDGLTFHTRNNGTELLKKEDSGTSLKNDLAVGIGGQPVSTERKIPNELNRNARDNITIISVSDKSDANLSKVSEDRHRASKSTESITANSSKCNVTKAKIDTKF